MPSPTEISNIALANIGAENLVSSIDPPDGSVEAGYCATFYPIARSTVLEMVKPAFALRRATLAEVTNVSDQWLFAYALPSDSLKPLRVIPLVSLASYLVRDDDGIPYLTNLLMPEVGSSDFVIESGVLRTNEPDAVLIYVADETDTTKWTPMFADAVAAVLSGYLAGPIIKGEVGRKIGSDWRRTGYDLARAAASSAANSSSEPAGHIPDHIRARA